MENPCARTGQVHSLFFSRPRYDGAIPHRQRQNRCLHPTYHTKNQRAEKCRPGSRACSYPRTCPSSIQRSRDADSGNRYKNSSSLRRGRIQRATGSISWRRSTCYRHAGTNLRPPVKKYSFVRSLENINFR